MLSKVSVLFVIALFGILFFSCSSKLKVSETYFQEVKPGLKGLETKTEFVIFFRKPVKKDVAIKELSIYGYKGIDYHYSDLVLSDISLSKTLNETENLKFFALYVNTNKAAKENPSKEKSLHARLTYSDGFQDKQLSINSFTDKGVKRLRN